LDLMGLERGNKKPAQKKYEDEGDELRDIFA
jgi:hypothetical protein